MKRLILGLAIGAMLAGCSSSGSSDGTSGTRSFRDGYAFAQATFIQQGQAMIGTPQAECIQLAAQGNSIPNQDDQGQWQSGCQAALASVPTSQVTPPTSG